MGVYRTGPVCPMQAGLKLHLSVSRLCAFSRVSILCTLNILGTSALQSSSSNTLIIEVLSVLLGSVTGVVVIVAAIVIGCCVCRRRRKLSKSLKVWSSSCSNMVAWGLIHSYFNQHVSMLV